MEQQAFESVRLLPRGDLEAFAVRAALCLRDHRKELDSSRLFLVALTGFLLGALVASAGFLFGASLG